MVAVLMLVLMAAGLVLIYQGTKQRQRHHAERELQLVSQLQAASLRAWREQRRTDVAVLSDNNLLGMALTAWLASSEVHGERAFLQRQLQRDLRTLQEQRNYSAAYLVDLNGQVQLSASGAVYRPLPDAEAQALRTALRTAQPAFVEPRRDDAFAFPFFSMLAPVYSDMEAVGAIWLVVDVRASLYPLLERWPSGSQTAESAIVTRDGNDALILNPLRHSPDTELPLRVPLTNTDNPVVEAVLGMRGVFHSRDYRGEPVIAVASTVPNSPWFLVSKIDTREAMATNWRELLALGSPIFMGLLYMGVVLIYLQRQVWLRERELKQQLERTLHWLQDAQETALVGYFAYSLDGSRAFSVSPATYKIFGLHEGVPMSLDRWLNSVHPEDRKRTVDAYRKAVTLKSPLHIQHRIMRETDQQERWVETWGEYEDDPRSKGGIRLIGTIQDITDRKRIEEELEQAKAALEAQVRLDPLTRIANRLALDEHLQKEWRRAVRNEQPLSLLMIDVDHFKYFNDENGHVAGDQCLQRVATVISSVVLRSMDMVARYGGEEFVVVLPDTESRQAVHLADRIRLAMHAEGIEHGHTRAAGVVTLSIGVVCAYPAGDAPVEQSVQALLEQADVALYEAKHSGRDRVALYDGGVVRVVAGGDVEPSHI